MAPRDQGDRDLPRGREVTDWGNIAQIAAAIVGVAGFLTSLWAARAKRFDDKIEAVIRKNEAAIDGVRPDISRAFERIDGAEQRLARVENELAHLPNKDMVHALQLGMSELKGQMAALVERVTPIARSIDRVEQSLMERADK